MVVVRYCARAEHNWTEFTEEMDVGPICPRGSDPPYVAWSQGEDGERDRLQVGREIQHSMIKERSGASCEQGRCVSGCRHRARA